MTGFATLGSDWEIARVAVLGSFVIASVFVSPLADLLTRSYPLLIAKIAVVTAGVLLRDSVEPHGFIGAFLGLAFVSFFRAYRWFRQPPPR